MFTMLSIHTTQLMESIFQSVTVQLWTTEMKILLSNCSVLECFLGSVRFTGLFWFSWFIEQILKSKKRKKNIFFWLIFLWLIFHDILKLRSQISNSFNKCIDYQVYVVFL